MTEEELRGQMRSGRDLRCCRRAPLTEIGGNGTPSGALRRECDRSLSYPRSDSVSEAFAEGGRFLRGANSRRAVDEPNYRHSRLLRTRRERPRGRAAECGQQFPPSDGDCHTPLQCEVRRENDTTPRACRLYVQGAQDAAAVHWRL
jgi:hypothetical protein